MFEAIIHSMCALNSTEGANSAILGLFSHQLGGQADRNPCAPKSMERCSSIPAPKHILGAQNCCRRSTHTDLGSGGDEEVGADFGQAWPLQEGFAALFGSHQR